MSGTSSATKAWPRGVIYFKVEKDAFDGKNCFIISNNRK
jgi:hypothetical protein